MVYPAGSSKFHVFLDIFIHNIFKICVHVIAVMLSLPSGYVGACAMSKGHKVLEVRM